MIELHITPAYPMQPDSPLDNHHHPESSTDFQQSEEMQQLLSLFADANNPESSETLEAELFSKGDAKESLTVNHLNLLETSKTTITQLQDALAASEQQLQAQIQRSHDTDTLIAQQTEELNETQQQIAYLIDALESSQEDAQRQQLQIENLTEQLISSQQQTAHLERECALLKEDCQEKTQKLFTAEKHIRELISRLQRQQRYTLQYKATLEQYLGNSPPQVETQPLSEVNIATLSSQVTVIKPWSSQQHDSPATANQEINVLEDISEETDSPLTTTAELESTSKQTYPPEIETALGSETPIIANTVSQSEEITDAETIFSLDNHQQPAPEIRKPNLPALLISGKRKSKGIVDLPGFLRHRSS